MQRLVLIQDRDNLRLAKPLLLMESKPLNGPDPIWIWKIMRGTDHAASTHTSNYKRPANSAYAIILKINLIFSSPFKNNLYLWKHLQTL